MKLPHCTVRDLFYLTLACALVVSLLLDRHRLAERIADAEALKLLRERKQNFLPKRRVDAKLLASIRTLDDAALNEYIPNIVETEVRLLEMVRRGMVEELARHYRIVMARKKQMSWTDNLEALIALRRAQGKPDPLEISLEWEQPVFAARTSLPVLKATIKNVDEEREPIMIMRGGDDQVNRLGRWQIHLFHIDGRAIPPAEFVPGRTGSQSVSFRDLDFGETASFTLEMRNYVETPPPGKFKLQVFYHNSETIVDYANLTGLIVSKSKPVDFVVEPLSIRLTKKEHEAAKRLVKEIDPLAEFKVVSGTYGPWAHEFVPPQTAHGQLLAMEERAVPALMEALARQGLAEHEIAWLLNLLFSATGEHDPRGGFLLPQGSYIASSPWGDGRSPWRFKRLASGDLGRGVIDPKEQAAFIRQWQRWYKLVKVQIE